MAVAIRNSTSGTAAKWRYRAAQLAFAASAARLALALHAGFRPEQPRVPAGNSDGGQWTKVPGWARGLAALERPSSSELWPTGKPTNAEDWREHLHLIGGRGRRSGGGQIRINGRWLSVTHAQVARITITQRAMDLATANVRRIDPQWRPRPQWHETVEGRIQANEASRLEAELRMLELTGKYSPYGPFYGGRIPSPPPGKQLNAAQRRELDRLGQTFGCHGCGTKENLTKNGHSVGDHQISRALGLPTYILPHCMGCSNNQGGLISGYLRRLQNVGR